MAFIIFDTAVFANVNNFADMDVEMFGMWCIIELNIWLCIGEDSQKSMCFR